MNIFFSSAIEGDIHILPESESKHAIQVLRLKKGDEAVIFDGKGGKYFAEIIDPHQRKCEVRITRREFTEKRNFHLHIAIAPTKMNERMEWFLEKATETGIDEITPIICSRSERKTVNSERFEKVLVAAMKQSLNPWLPRLNAQLNFSEFLNGAQTGFIAHCHELPKEKFMNLLHASNNITVMIGPEGDFTDLEINAAIKLGWKGVSLGDSRLRTETAGLIACAAVNLLKC